MPWWFWVITHIWVMCVPVMFVIFIHDNDHNKVDTKWEWLLVVALHLFAPLVFVYAFCSFIWNELITKLPELIRQSEWKWLKWLKKPLKWFIEWKKRKKDFKHMEENEDEWEAERVGIKLK